VEGAYGVVVSRSTFGIAIKPKPARWRYDCLSGAVHYLLLSLSGRSHAAREEAASTLGTLSSAMGPTQSSTELEEKSMNSWYSRAATMFAAFSMVVLAASGCKSQLDDKPAATVAAQPEKVAPSGAVVDEVAAAGYTVVKAKSSIGFVGRKVTLDHEGSFADFTGSVSIDEGRSASVNFTVKMASVVVEPEKLRGHLMSADFFDVEKHPAATFKSTAITESAEGGTHTVTGDLTLRGVTRKISFPATLKAEGATAHGMSEFKINRKDFGIVYPGMPDDLIADDVLIKLDLHFTERAK